MNTDSTKVRLVTTAQDLLAVQGRTGQPPLFAPISRQAAMELAYQTALQGAGYVGQNPLVGAVLVDAEHRFVAAAAHLRFGGPHAEANLLAHINAQGLQHTLAGATLYCTLEPCAHTGKTPPCAQLLSGLGLKALICAAVDPNPRVDGKGMGLLRASGVDVQVAADFAAVTAGLLAPFEAYIAKRQPLIAAKIACSLDGVIGQQGDERVWITGPRAREFGHWLRLLYDGIVVGAATLIADNPRLDVRHPSFPNARAPARIVLDPTARALSARPLEAQHILAHEPAKVFWVVSPEGAQSLSAAVRESYTAMGGHLLVVPLVNGQGFNLPTLLAQLGELGLTSLLLEGGRGVWGHFFNANLVEKLYLLQAPVLLGSPQSMHWSEVVALPNAQRLNDVSLCPLGDNWLTEAAVHAP